MFAARWPMAPGSSSGAAGPVTHPSDLGGPDAVAAHRLGPRSALILQWLGSAPLVVIGVGSRLLSEIEAWTRR